MTEESGLDARTLLLKAYERLFPAIGYFIGGTSAGLAASITVLATWIIVKARGSRRHLREEEEEEAVVELSARIEEHRRRVELLEEELARARDELERRLLEKSLAVEKALLEEAVEEYEARQLRLLALRKLRETGDERLYRAVEELVKRIERGENVEEEQLRVLEELEEKWRRRELSNTVLLRVLGAG